MSDTSNPLLIPKPMRFEDELAWSRMRFAFVVLRYRQGDRQPMTDWLAQIAQRCGDAKTGVPPRTVANQCRHEAVKFARSDKVPPQ